MKHIKSGIAAFAAFMLAAAVMPVAAFAERVVNEDVTLAADADWSADGLVTIKPGARINLAGHNLTVADIEHETGVVTNATGVVEGYKDLALIRTSSSNLGYINTDIVPAATDRIVFKVRYDESDTPQAFFFTSRKSAGSGDFTLAYYRGNGLRIDYNGAQNIYGTNIVLTVGNTYEIDFDANAKTCTVNGEACMFSKSFPTKAFTPSAPLCIFQISNNGTVQTASSYNQYIPRASLYYFFIYGSDGTLKHELRPAVKIDGNVTGLYDRKTDTFYASSINFHTGVADASGVTNTADGDAAELVVNGGAASETIAGYTVLKSITATGAQYIKVPTNHVTVAATARVEMKLKPTDVSSTRCFWSSRYNSNTRNFSCWQQPVNPNTEAERGLRFDFNAMTSMYANPNYYMAADETHEIVFDGYTRTVLVDGEDKGFDITASSDFTITNSLFILTVMDTSEKAATGYNAKCELFYFRLYDKDGNLKLDMVPAYSATEAAAGLYDRVGKAFFKSATATAFVSGEYADDTTLTVTTQSLPSQSLSAIVSGNVKVVKDGRGILTVKKSGQTYTGGTEVRGGTLKLGSNGNYTILPAAGTVTVCDGGTFEMDGYAGWDGRSFVLDGGTLQNSKDLYGSSGKWNAAMSSVDLLGNVTLTKDSTLRISKTYGFNDGATLNLGGHKLRAEVAKDEILVMRSAVVSNGTLNVVNGGWMYVPAEKTCDATDNASILSSTALAIAGALNVKDFTDAKTTNANSYDSSSGAINVYGTFTPKSDYFYGVTMQSGSSFDLSTKTDPWNVASSATDNNTVSFADNAAIGLVLGERTTRGTIPVVTWTTAPANLGSLTFRRIDAGQERTAAKESSGIYFHNGLIISFH